MSLSDPSPHDTEQLSFRPYKSYSNPQQSPSTLSAYTPHPTPADVYGGSKHQVRMQHNTSTPQANHLKHPIQNSKLTASPWSSAQKSQYAAIAQRHAEDDTSVDGSSVGDYEEYKQQHVEPAVDIKVTSAKSHSVHQHPNSTYDEPIDLNVVPVQRTPLNTVSTYTLSAAVRPVARSQHLTTHRTSATQPIHELTTTDTDDILYTLDEARTDIYTKLHHKLKAYVERDRQRELQVQALQKDLHTLRTNADYVTTQKQQYQQTQQKYYARQLQQRMLTSVYIQWKQHMLKRQHTRYMLNNWVQPRVDHKTKAALFHAWSSCARTKQQRSQQQLYKTQLKETVSTLVDNYERSISDLRHQLQRTQFQVQELTTNNNNSNQRLKQSYLRSVCAINTEALGYFSSKDLQSVSDVLQRQQQTSSSAHTFNETISPRSVDSLPMPHSQSVKQQSLPATVIKQQRVTVQSGT